MNIENLLVIALITNAALFFVSMSLIFQSRLEVKRWKDFAILQCARQDEIFTWLTNNLSEFGDFGQGDEPNIITFRKK